MKTKIRGALLALGLSGLPAGASATGGVDCGIRDENIDFSFEALFGHGVFTSLFQVRASLDVKSPKLHGVVETIEMDGSHLKQQWFQGSDLKLLFYAEAMEKNAPFAAAKLSIEATQPPGEDFAFNGKYLLELEGASTGGGNGEPLKLEGEVDCSAG